MSSLSKNRNGNCSGHKNRNGVTCPGTPGHGQGNGQPNLIVACLVLSVVTCNICSVDAVPVPAPHSQSQSELQQPRRVEGLLRGRSQSQGHWEPRSVSERPAEASEAISSSLSIVSPLEVLRQLMAAEERRHRIQQLKARQVASNKEYMSQVGRRRRRSTRN